METGDDDFACWNDDDDGPPPDVVGFPPKYWDGVKLVERGERVEEEPRCIVFSRQTEYFWDNSHIFFEMSSDDEGPPTAGSGGNSSTIRKRGGGVAASKFQAVLSC